MSNRYKLRGVSSDKEDVHNAIKNQDKGLYPKAFCKILPDFLSGSNDHALLYILTVPELSHLLRTFIGRKLETYLYGKELLKTLL